MKVSQFLGFAKKPFSISFKLAMVLFILAATFTSCDSDKEDPIPVEELKSIAAIVVENDDFSSLEAALIKTGLLSNFQIPTQYTVFAPTNAAFEAFLTVRGLTLETVSTSDLTAILLGHVVAGENKSASLSNGKTLIANNASFLNVRVTNVDEKTVISVNNATITTADVDASNGVIHVVNSVIQ